MMKSRSVLMKAMIKPLLKDNSDLVMIGNKIIVKPVNHLMKFVILFGSSRKSLVGPEFCCSFLFKKRERFEYEYARSLPLDENQSSSNRLWYMDKDDGIGLRFKTMVEEHALPFLRGIRSLADYEAIVNDPVLFRDMTMNRFVIEQAILDAGLGRFEAAREACRRLIAGQDGMAPHLMADRLRLLTELAPPLFADDKAGVSAVLHRWEEYTVKACGLEKHWQKTPFPFEET